MSPKTSHVVGGGMGAVLFWCLVLAIVVLSSPGSELRLSLWEGRGGRGEEKRRVKIINEINK